MGNEKLHISKIHSVFKQRNTKNPSYSIRSFARDLNIDPSSLSSIMNGRRKIPKGKIEAIGRRICSTDEELHSFLESADQEHVSLQLIKKSKEIEERHHVNETDFATISCIKTYALLSMLELDDFRYDKTWIAHKLKLDIAAVERKIASLIEIGFVEEVGGTIVRTKLRTTTTDEIVSKYIMKHHLDSLDQAKEKCVELSPQERYFSSITMPFNPESMENVKKLIRDFEDKMSAYVKPLPKKDVYKLSIQFYQATEKDI